MCTAQTAYVNIDSGLFVRTTTTQPGAVVITPSTLQPSFIFYTGMFYWPATAYAPAISFAVQRDFVPPLWVLTPIFFQLTLHYYPLAKWYGNHWPMGNGYFSPYQNSDSTFSGEFSALLICSTDSSDILSVHGFINDLKF